MSIPTTDSWGPVTPTVEELANDLRGLRAEMKALRTRVEKIEGFVTNPTALWPMSPSPNQAHTSKTDDKAALAKLIADG